ncbi:MAG: hypothetical protein GY750_20740 [Lentisphaerae bacterium]|nr:hypothetical protein [Lentisphaerota bacterium]MCP4103819.1 hypothetical protein [Lentisphaerota bacterium]
MLSQETFRVYLNKMNSGGGLATPELEEVFKSLLGAPSCYVLDDSQKHLFLGRTRSYARMVSDLGQLSYLPLLKDVSTLESIHVPIAFEHLGRSHFVFCQIMIINPVSRGRLTLNIELHDSTNNPIGIKFPCFKSYLQKSVKMNILNNNHFQNANCFFNTSNHGVQNSFGDKKCSLYSFAASYFSYHATLQGIKLSSEKIAAIYKLIKNLPNNKALLCMCKPYHEPKPQNPVRDLNNRKVSISNLERDWVNIDVSSLPRNISLYDAVVTAMTKYCNRYRSKSSRIGYKLFGAHGAVVETKGVWLPLFRDFANSPVRGKLAQLYVAHLKHMHGVKFSQRLYDIEIECNGKLRQLLDMG